jgi:uncharacterized protein YndB with AHSA1/START domain
VSAGQARVTVSVAVPIEDAFRVFTSEIDRWWRRGPRFRHAGNARGIVHVEPRVGGRLFESWQGPHGEQLFVAGIVRRWEPPRALAFSWRNSNFAPQELTEVEIEFASRDQHTTVVTVTHRGWESLRPDHPARHGLDDRGVYRMIGLWWGEQLSSLREFGEAGGRGAGG